MCAVLDGELVALDADGKPDFPLVCERVLMRRTSALLTFIVLDVLLVEDRNVSLRCLMRSVARSSKTWSPTGRLTHERRRIGDSSGERAAR